MIMKGTRIIIWLLALAFSYSIISEIRAERGVASYYHDRFHGRRMANGKPYNRDSFTCAHRRYSFGTWLRVTNVRNGLSCVVQVTDRGPYSHRYTIDLSRAAAKRLDIIHAGHAPVEITQVSSREGILVPYRVEEQEEELIDIDLEFVPAPEFDFPAMEDDDTD